MIGPLSETEVSAFLERAVDAGHEPLAERTFAELADCWRALGLHPGDLVLLALPTGVALLQHLFAVIAAGGVPALLAPGAPAARLREAASKMGARVVGAVRLPPLPEAERVEPVGLLETAWLPDPGNQGLTCGDVVLLTSGTSGSASGCVTTLEAMVRNGRRHAGSIGQRASDTVLVSLPLHFSFAMVAQALGTFAIGGRLVIAGPPFNPEAYARMVSARGVTVSALTPVQVRALLQPRAHETPLPASLRVISVGGDSLAPAHVAELLRRRPEGELYLTYGLTQAGPRVSTLAAHVEPTHRHTSVGRPLEGTRVMLAGLDDGSGRTELLVASDTVMRRRIGLVEGRSGDDFRGGFLATGDIFSQDEEGYLYHRGRLTEYLLRGGEKVCLATVRRLAAQLPGVLSARTRVAEGGDDFELTLMLAETAVPESPEHYRALLARRVLRAELPRTLHVAGYEAQAFSYK